MCLWWAFTDGASEIRRKPVLWKGVHSLCQKRAVVHAPTTVGHTPSHSHPLRPLVRTHRRCDTLRPPHPRSTPVPSTSHRVLPRSVLFPTTSRLSLQRPPPRAAVTLLLRRGDGAPSLTNTP